MRLSDGTTAKSLAFVAGRIGGGVSPPAHEPPLLLVTHGAGYNAGTWLSALHALHGALPGCVADVMAFDFTGHGLSRALPGSGYSASRFDWDRVLPHDVREALQQAGASKRDVYGVGHSMGATGLVLAELARPGTFRGLLLLEPIIRPHAPPGEHPLVRRTLRRRARFEAGSHAEVAESFASRAMRAWERRAVDAYVQRGVRARGGREGGFELTCEPEVEASAYMGGMACQVFDRLGNVRCPVVVAAGAHSLTLAVPLAGDEGAPPARSNLEGYAAVAGAFGALAQPLVVAQHLGHSIPSVRSRAERLPPPGMCCCVWCAPWRPSCAVRVPPRFSHCTPRAHSRLRHGGGRCHSPCVARCAPGTSGGPGMDGRACGVGAAHTGHGHRPDTLGGRER